MLAQYAMADNTSPLKDQAPKFDGMAFVRTLPQAPGVYRYYDTKGNLLYVGKARNLQNRVRSYFRGEVEDPRIRSMVQLVARAEFTVVPTEVDALVLESRLIKHEKPKYNIRLRDGAGSYPYLHLSTHKNVPQLTVAYNKRDKHGKYFGPFPSRHAVYQAHDALQKFFGLRTCSDTFFSHRSRPCLEYQIGRCSAPCVWKISQEEYRERVQQVIEFLEGRGLALVEQLQEQMNQAAEKLDFEKAAVLRDRITSLRHVQNKVSVEQGEGSFDVLDLVQEQGQACTSIIKVRQGQVIGANSFCFSVPWESSNETIMTQVLAQHYLDEDMPMPNKIILAFDIPERDVLAQAFAEKGASSLVVGAKGKEKVHLELANKNARASLDAALMSKKVQATRWEAFCQLVGQELPEDARVECFDISHTMGKDTVASCVVASANGPRRVLYRRYNITDITPGDDIAAMRQALERRLSGKHEPPTVLLIDGGKVQVQQAVEVARSRGYDFPIIGVSKGVERIGGEEDLILDDGQTIIHPGPDSAALMYIRSVRDEAHRFALHGHRRKRDKGTATSVLDKIPGIGKKKRQALLTAFGGIQGLKQASKEAISQVPGIGPVLAEQIILAMR